MDLSDLYQEMVLEHGKKPRNFRAIEHADYHAEGFNPLCGDRIEVFVNLDNQQQRISDIAFTGSACAICTASASIMTDRLKQLSPQQARELFQRFQKLVTVESDEESDENTDAEDLGELQALAGVRRFPMRVKCATLPWHTAIAAIQGERSTSTE